MESTVMRRYVFIMGTVLFLFFTLWILLSPGRAPGDFHTEMGDIRLGTQDYEEALEYFDKALEKMPDHRGALMGRALVFISTEQYEQAIDQLGYLIDFLEHNLEDNDLTGRGVLAAAYANRGIVHDRQARHRMALADYVNALKTDEESLKGPRLFHRILHGRPRPATVRARATFLAEQLSLPEEERAPLLLPEKDAEERMYKP